jgi:pyruvate/2-oxoglutarate dehydrogenase complex dihydrolipoamide acyltransferase (E2) component
VTSRLFTAFLVYLFAALGVVRKDLVVVDGKAEVREVVRVRYSFDERINDGFYCASSLGIVREHVEAPEKFIQEGLISRSR